MQRESYKVILYSACLVFCLCIALAIDAQDNQGQASGQISSALSGIQSFPEQFAMGFGYCPSDYTYTMQVWNDLAVPLKAQLQSVVSVQGAKFDSTTKASRTIAPYQATRSGDFSQVHLCHAIVRLLVQSQVNRGTILDLYQSIFERPIDIDKTDKNTYYYHAFTLHGKQHGEFLGPGLYGGPYTSSSDFDGVFFNSSPFDVQLEFTKTINGQDRTYKVTLESDSFSMLSSDTTEPNSIRSSLAARAFKFIMPEATTVAIPVASSGLGQSYYDAAATTTITVPLTNTYEVYGNTKNSINVGIQGFNMGNYNQRGMRAISSQPPQTLAKMRDINPVACSLWYQSAAQYQKSLPQSGSSPTMVPYDMAEQVWIIYTSKDYTLQQQVPLGAAPSFLLIRPTAEEGEKQLYVFSVATDDSAKAQQFLANITQDPGFLPHLLKSGLSDPTLMTTNDIARVVTRALSSPTHGLVTDARTGMTALLLLADTLVAYGGGEETPRFYQLVPPLLQIDNNFASIVTSYLDPTLFSGGAQQANAEFHQSITSWLNQFSKVAKSLPSTISLANVDTYASQLENAVPDLTTYLKSKGVQTLFSNPSSGPGQRIFNSRGIRALYFILIGPVSLKNPPLLRQAGTNAYLTGSKPTDWPAH